MAVLSAVSEWDHYLCSSCSTMSALRPGMPTLTATDPLSRWPSPAITRDDRSTDDDRTVAIGAAEVEASLAPPPEPDPALAIPMTSLPVPDIETIAPPLEAVAQDPEAVPMSTRMREIVVQAERTENPWGI